MHIRKCSSCGTSVRPSLFPFHNLEEEVEVSQLRSVNVERKTKKHSEIKYNNQQKDARITKKVNETKKLLDVFEMMIQQLNPFDIHNYTKQLHKFKDKKTNLTPGEVIISEDFSGNYSIKHQDEIMSAN